MVQSLIRRASSNRSGWLFFSIAACYALLMGVVGSRLTFFAEDYDIFLNQSEAGLGVLLLGNGGHWGPISRLLVLGQTHLFGTWYPGYLAINGFLLASGLMAFATPLARSLNVSRWWVQLAFIQVALVPGVMAVVLLASNGAWTLSFFLAGLAALAGSQARWRLAVTLVFASCLSMSGLGIFWALLAVGFSGTHALVRAQGQIASWQKFASSSVGLALVVLLVGRVAASHWDSPYFSQYGPDAGSAIVIPDLNTADVLGTWLVIVGTWSIIAIWPAITAFLSDPLPRIAFVLVDYRILAIVVWLIIVLAAVLLVRRVRSVRWITVFTITVAPALIWAAAIAALREGQVHSERYMFVWLPSLIGLSLVVAVALTSRPTRGNTAWGIRLLQTLTLSSALVLLLSLPATLQMAANVDRPRWDLSRLQTERAQDCTTGSAIKGVPEVSPIPTGEYLCELTTYLDKVSLLN